ncbi:MAG TPA: hypothetical protein DHV48_11395 [Prolixibacteraceae bacterium]|nr:hypothetical protein [Prolixibacteraceae bacterium]
MPQRYLIFANGNSAFQLSKGSKARTKRRTLQTAHIKKPAHFPFHPEYAYIYGFQKKQPE